MFTKYDQFLYNVEMHLEDHPNDYPNSNVSDAAERQFKERWLGPLGNDVIFVRLKSGFRAGGWDYILTFLCRYAPYK